MNHLRDETGRNVTQTAQWRGGKERRKRGKSPGCCGCRCKIPPKVTIPPIKTCFITRVLLLLTHLPSKRSEGGAGIRSPGDNEQQDNDERDLCHLPFALHLMQPLHRVSGSLTADLRYRSVMQIGEVRKTMTNEPAAPCDLCCHRHTSLQGESDVGGNPGEKHRSLL